VAENRCYGLRVRLLLLLLIAAPAHAANFWVDAAGSTPWTDIQPALDAAEDGDVVLVLDGTYGPIDFDGKAVVLRSVGGPSNTIIDATGVPGPVVAFGDHAPDGALLHGFTITGGTGEDNDTTGQIVGGGIFVARESTPRISGNLITGNSAEVGAGIGVVNASPRVYGNQIHGNSASTSAGGLWIWNPNTSLPIVVACNELHGNDGAQVGGAFVGPGNAELSNNTFVGNTGERGGLWTAVDAAGEVINNTLVANEGQFGSAAGVEAEGSGVDFRNNVVAFNNVGWGVIRAASSGWSWNSVASNGGGEYAGAAGDPTGIDGNRAEPPLFTNFTPGDPYDDDLSLDPASTLIDGGDPAGLYADRDGSINDMGSQGGPHEDCDGDGDGVLATDGDCRPAEADFFPGADEKAFSLDHDCDGFGTIEVLNFVASDGGLIADGDWEYGPPASVPGVGQQSANCWCTDCDGDVGAASSGALTWTNDLSSVPAGVGVRLRLVQAWDHAAGDGAILQADDAGWLALEPDGGYPGDLTGTGNPIESDATAGAWTGGRDSWRRDTIPLDSYAGVSLDLRLLAGAAVGSPGHALCRIDVSVEDSDGDGRIPGATDCDDDEVTVYEGAPEVPYDGIDQDCDGTDLLDVDGDGFDALVAGGTDCDDEAADAFPGGTEVAYDGVDQDCDGADWTDVDGDGADSTEVGGPDCDDDNAAIGPDADEIPYDGIDQDCDGTDLTDVDGDGYHGDVGVPFGDCDDNDPAVHPGVAEDCSDGVDNDCDGSVDRQGDGDGDGVDACDGDCDDDNAQVAPGFDEACDGFDSDCDGVLNSDELDGDGDGALPCEGDCDDAQAAAGPDFTEVCDELDNDCDDEVDEGLDEDGDGFSGCGADCDDRRSVVYPGAELRCDENLDADCNGTPDFEEDACQESTGCAVGGSGASLLVLLSGLAAPRRRRAARRP